MKIQLHDGETLSGAVIFGEPAYDLAVVRINTAKKLPALHFEPATDLMEGEMVIAIGHPYGYRNTVSSGIISALGREVEAEDRRTLPLAFCLRFLYHIFLRKNRQALITEKGAPWKSFSLSSTS